jgi:hypothetical protein
LPPARSSRSPREIFHRDEDLITENLDAEHGVLAAWVRNARPMQKRLLASNDPGHPAKPSLP